MLDRFMDWTMGGGFTRCLFGAFVLTGGLVALLVAPFVIYDAMQPKFALRKDEWGCTASHQETTYVMSGKVMVPVTSTVCDQWTRR